MSPIAHLRRIAWLPRLLLAVVVLAALQTSLVPCAMANDSASTMTEHCAYCPPDVSDAADAVMNDCVFPHAPTVNVFASSAHHVDILLDSPLLQPATFDLATLHAARSFVPIARAVPWLERPHTLTHCVQLK